MSTQIEASFYLANYKEENKDKLLEVMEEACSEAEPKDWWIQDTDTQFPGADEWLANKDVLTYLTVENELPETFDKLKEIEPGIKLHVEVRYIEQTPTDSFDFGGEEDE